MDQGGCFRWRPVSQGFSEGVADQFTRYAENWAKYETTNPRYEDEAGSGNYMTTREAMERAGKSVPEYAPDVEYHHIVSAFWELKRFCKEMADPITPDLMAHYLACQGALLSRDERSIIYKTDYALRGALAKERAKNDRYQMQKARKK